MFISIWKGGGAGDAGPEPASGRREAVDGDVTRQEPPRHTITIGHSCEIKGSAQTSTTLRCENRRFHKGIDSTRGQIDNCRITPPNSRAVTIGVAIVDRLNNLGSASI